MDEKDRQRQALLEMQRQEKAIANAEARQKAAVRVLGFQGFRVWRVWRVRRVWSVCRVSPERRRSIAEMGSVLLFAKCVGFGAS
jgi:hypothetical protein